jgi:hypothetical protein
MPFTLVAYNEDVVAPKTYYTIKAVEDPHLTVKDEDVTVPPELPNIVALAIISAGVTNARVASPSLRSMVVPEIIPVDRASEPSSPAVISDLRTIPIALVGEEALNLELSMDVSTRATGLVWLADAPIAPVTGKMFTVKCTSATTLTPWKWTNGTLTFTQDLPVGRYQVVGMRAESAGLLAARLVFPGYAWRPGVIGTDARTDLQDEIFRNGKFGVFGEFAHNRPPTVDFLSSSADTSEIVYLDLIKIA